MERVYSFLGTEHFVDMVRDTFARNLARRGYHLEVSGAGPGSPHVYEYRSGDRIIAVKVDDTAGEKWEAEIVVEGLAPADEFEAIVVDAVAGLLDEVSRLLLESIVDESCRTAVAQQLSRAIADLV